MGPQPDMTRPYHHINIPTSSDRRPREAWSDDAHCCHRQQQGLNIIIRAAGHSPRGPDEGRSRDLELYRATVPVRFVFITSVIHSKQQEFQEFHTHTYPSVSGPNDVRYAMTICVSCNGMRTVWCLDFYYMTINDSSGTRIRGHDGVL